MRGVVPIPHHMTAASCELTGTSRYMHTLLLRTPDVDTYKSAERQTSHPTGAKSSWASPSRSKPAYIILRLFNTIRSIASRVAALRWPTTSRVDCCVVYFDQLPFWRYVCRHVSEVCASTLGRDSFGTVCMHHWDRDGWVPRRLLLSLSHH